MRTIKRTNKILAKQILSSDANCKKRYYYYREEHLQMLYFVLLTASGNPGVWTGDRCLCTRYFDAAASLFGSKVDLPLPFGILIVELSLMSSFL